MLDETLKVRVSAKGSPSGIAETERATTAEKISA